MERPMAFALPVAKHIDGDDDYSHDHPDELHSRESYTALAFVLPVAEVVPDAAQPSYCVDWWVDDETKRHTKWEQSRIEIVGQALRVLVESKKVLFEGSTPLCEMTSSRDSPNLILTCQGNPGSLKLHCPSAKRTQALRGVFEASQATAQWTRPANSVVEAMIGVAEAILDTTAASPTSPPPADVASCQVTIDQVQVYLRSLVEIYSNMSVAVKTKQDLYHVLLHLESEYSVNPTPSSFAHQVLQLHLGAGGTRGVTYQLFCSQCPTCHAPLAFSTTFAIHVEGETLYCPHCECTMSYETFKLQELLHTLPKLLEFKTGFVVKDAQSIRLPGLPQDGRISTYLDTLWATIDKFRCPYGDKCPRKVVKALAAQVDDVLDRMDLVQHMYQQLFFVSQIVTHVEYWMTPAVIAAAIQRYDRFQHISKHRDGSLIPTLDIVLIGQVVAMAPPVQPSSKKPPKRASSVTSTNLKQVKSMVTETALLWKEAFGDLYTSAALDHRAWLATKYDKQRQVERWDKFGGNVASDSKFVGVEETFQVGALRHAAALADVDGTEKTSVSVIGAFAFDMLISGGRLRTCLPKLSSDAIYNYRGTDTPAPTVESRPFNTSMFAVM